MTQPTALELVDSSAWIEFLRGTGSPAHLEVRRLLREEPHAVAVTEPIVMELRGPPTIGPSPAWRR